MEKKFLTIAGFLFLFAFVFFIFSIHTTQKITGLAIFTSQPDQTNGTDTYIREDYPNNNFPTATGLIIGKTAENKTLRALLNFNISSIPTTDTILNATIQVYLESATGSSNITITAYRIASPWTDTGASWNNRTATSLWTTAGGNYDISPIDSQTFLNSSGHYYNFTITNLARNWLNGTYNNYGIILTAPTATAGNFSQISSSDSTTAIQRPVITINHVPNAHPSITAISTDTTLTNPKEAGTPVTFTINWSDIESDNSQAYVCNSSNITTSGCSASTLCSTALASTNPIICSYTTSILDNSTTYFWVAVCDAGGCSLTSSENYFYINHKPSIQIIQPNGGELINQSQGNYPIEFDVSDQESDPLTANIYYGTTQNATTNLIASNLNLTNYCTDPDSTTATTNNCTYSWDSSGLYGTYYLTIIANDSRSTNLDSSNSSFEVKSILDTQAPQITNVQITPNLTAGEQTQITATITDDNMKSAWIDFNYTSINLTMSNSTATSFFANFDAPATGTYQFKVYAEDRLGQINDTIQWQEFKTTEPNATAGTISSPSIALPYHVIKVEGILNAIDSLKNVHAYLSTPTGFTFLSNYPQNLPMGNFTANQSKTATWFLSVPLQEATYILNIKYTDGYSDSWNSSNTSIQVTSAIGSYAISVAGYPEVESSHDYRVKSYFKQNGIPANADSMQATIYDSTGSLVVGPISMTKDSTGTYGYNYSVPSAPNEGTWETIINATKTGTSYYAHQFWNVVGGPFDVRNITINDSTVPQLGISVTTQNTGGANKDLTLVWNLTETDNNGKLDSGSETFMVPANSEKIWTVYPSTNYIGQTKITFIGYYSGTEKAGAYKIFSTTLGNTTPTTPPQNIGGGGGGGGGSNTPQTLQNNKTAFTVSWNKVINLIQNTPKTIYFTINNTGDTTLANTSLSLENLATEYYILTPVKIASLKPATTAQFKITLLINDFIGEKTVKYKIKTGKLEKNNSFKLVVMNKQDYLSKELKRLEENINSLNQTIKNIELKEELKQCENDLSNLKFSIQQNNFTEANKNIKETDDCLKTIKNKLTQKPKPTTTKTNWKWIIIWALFLIVAILIVAIIYFFYKKLTLRNFIRKKQKKPQQEEAPRMTNIDDKIKEIEDKLK